ncbi:hypothetical protein ABK040_014709 [Willaertia magna]
MFKSSLVSHQHLLLSLPSEIVASILFYYIPKELSIKTLPKIIKKFTILLNINSQFKNMILNNEYFQNELILIIHSTFSFILFGHFMKLTENKINIRNLILKSYHLFSEKKERNVNEQINKLINNFHLKNLFISKQFLQKNLPLINLKNVDSIFFNLRFNNKDNEYLNLFIMNNLNKIKKIKFNLIYSYENLFEILNVLQSSNSSAEINIKSNYNDEILQYQYNNLITCIHTFKNNLNLKDFNNLKFIEFRDVENELIFDSLKSLKKIKVRSCNSSILISNCNNLKTVLIGKSNKIIVKNILKLEKLLIHNIKYCYVNVKNYINTLDVSLQDDIGTVFIKTKLVNNLEFNGNNLFEIYDVLFKRISKINNLNLSSFNETFFKFKNIIDYFGNLINNFNFTFSKGGPQFNDLNFQSVYSIESFTLKEMIDNYEGSIIDFTRDEEDNLQFIQQNDKYKVTEITIETECSNLSFINFNLLTQLSIYSSCLIDIKNLTALKVLNIGNGVIVDKFKHNKLKRLNIMKCDYININLNQLPNLKELEMLDGNDITLQTTTKELSHLTSIALNRLSLLNINLSLNSPYLLRFELTYYPTIEDIIHIHFIDTPLLRNIKIKHVIE